jgi:hypothetical protein
MSLDRLPLSDQTPGPDNRGLALQPQHLVLYRALSSVGDSEAGDQLAQCYLGAVAALADLGNPDRFAQAAHSLREIMDLMPYAVDVRVEALREKLTNKGAKLENAWQAAQKSTCLEDGIWSGKIDGRLKKFLREATIFYEWKAEHQPRRQVEFGMTLIELDVSGKPPPQPLHELNSRAWMMMHDYFAGVAHHAPLDDSEFDTWVDTLEQTILNLIVPRTYADFDAIDAILGAPDA